jgi:small subunit ribosomal protein S20
MPNLKNAIKKVKVNEKKNTENNLVLAPMKTAMKNVEKAVLAGDKKTAEDALKVAIKAIDKACSKGVVKQNYVSRHKSRLTNSVNLMK